MQAENLAGQAEPDAGPLLVRSEKRDEDPLQRLRHNPDPVVLDGKNHLAFRA